VEDSRVAPVRVPRLSALRFAFPAVIAKLQGEGGYVLGRAAALGSKPAILLLANHLAGNATASLIAVVFVVVNLAMAASGFNSHRDFYKLYFGEKKQRNLKRNYQSYINATTLQIFLAVIPIFMYMYWRHGQPMLAFVMGVYFASERLADEAQRFLIFQGARAEWGHKIFLKACIQVFGVATACAVASGEGAATLAVVALAAGNVVPYAGRLRWAHLPKRWSMALDGWRACREQTNYWILSAVTAPIAYMDRIVVIIYKQSDMAMFMLLVSCLSITQNAMEYFFYSMRRKEILQAKLNLREFLFSRSMHAIVGGSAAIGVVLSLIVLNQYSRQSIDYWSLIPIVLISQISLALSMVIRDIIFWNRDIFRLTLLEACFVAAVFVLLLALRAAGADYVVALGVLSALLVGRLTLLGGLSRAVQFSEL
jgi:hypothetical protein